MTINKKQLTHPKRITQKYLRTENGQQLIRDVAECSANMTDREIGEACGCQGHQVAYIRTKLGLQKGGTHLTKNFLKTEAGIALQRAVKNQGSLNDNELGNLYGLTARQIQNLRLKMGIQRRVISIPVIEPETSIKSEPVIEPQRPSRQPDQCNERLLVTFASGMVEMVPKNERGLDYIVDNFDAISDISRVVYQPSKWAGGIQ